MGIHFTDFFCGANFLFFSTGRGKLTRDWQPRVLQCMSPESNPEARLYSVVLALGLTFCIKHWLDGYTSQLSKESHFMHLFTASYKLNDTVEIIFCKMKPYQSETALPKQFILMSVIESFHPRLQCQPPAGTRGKVGGVIKSHPLGITNVCTKCNGKSL